MAFSTMRIDTAAMRSVNSDMANQNQTINTLLSTLQNNIESQMTGWSGVARNLYEERKLEWNQAAARMNEILQAMASNTASMAANYEDAESINSRMWR